MSRTWACVALRPQIWMAVVALAGVAWPGPAGAATFGVPTRIGTDGQVCIANGNPAGIGCTAAALDPPGYLILTGVDDTNDAGDTVHQMRFFIEVTGTTLDVRVFDAGRSTPLDDDQGAGETTFTYQLFNAAGTLLKSIAQGADTAPPTSNRLARMSATAADTAFVALNAGTVFTTTPGLYELRITAVERHRRQRSQRLRRGHPERRRRPLQRATPGRPTTTRGPVRRRPPPTPLSSSARSRPTATRRASATTCCSTRTSSAAAPSRPRTTTWTATPRPRRASTPSSARARHSRSAGARPTS